MIARALGILLYILVAASPAFSEVGVTEKEILLGSVQALTKTDGSKDRFVQTAKTFELIFKKINESGGIYGRKIRLISHDDKSVPEDGLAFYKELIEADRVFALFGSLGTGAIKAALPLIDRTGTPLLGVGTGLSDLHMPPKKNIYLMKCSHFDEADAMVSFLAVKKLTEIALARSTDPTGEDGRQGVLRALGKRSMKLAFDGVMPRQTTDVSPIYQQIKLVHPQAVVLWFTAQQAVDFMEMAVKDNWHPTYLVFSGGLNDQMLARLKKSQEAIFTMTYQPPDPESSSLKVAKDYVQLAKLNGMHIDLNGLEGYIGAMTLIEALKLAGPELTRKALLEVYEKRLTDFDLGGMKLEYSKDQHTAFSHVFPGKIVGGKLVELTN